MVKVRDIVNQPVALFENYRRLVHDGTEADDGLPGVVITIVESVNSIPKQNLEELIAFMSVVQDGQIVEGFESAIVDFYEVTMILAHPF